VRDELWTEELDGLMGMKAVDSFGRYSRVHVQEEETEKQARARKGG
jgi:hypothetical protein